MSDAFVRGHGEIQQLIQKENDLIHQRLSWLGAFQGLLFAALAFAWDKPTARYVIFVVCLLGMLIAVSVGVGTYRANVAIHNLETEWEEQQEPRKRRPNLGGIRSKSGAWWWIMPGYFIPWSFGVAWALVFLIDLLLQINAPRAISGFSIF